VVKKFYIFVALFLIAVRVFAQTLEMMSYQVVVIDADNAFVIN
jgi:hypothetical protein